MILEVRTYAVVLKLHRDASSFKYSSWSDTAVLEKFWCIYSTLKVEARSVYVHSARKRDKYVRINVQRPR